MRSALVAVEARGMPRRMTEFMQRGAMPIDRLEIGLRRRHLHVVFGRSIEGALAANAERDASGLDQGFDRRLNQARRRWRSCGSDLVRQILALVSIENGKTLEERYGLHIFTGLGRTPFLVARNETIGIDDGGAAFALTNVAAERERLTEGEPTLTGKSAFDHGSPENEDVNATVLPVSRRVFRHRQRRFCRGRSPGLDPGYPASLKFGDDLVGDFIIEICPVLAGAHPSVMS